MIAASTEMKKGLSEVGVYFPDISGCSVGENYGLSFFLDSEVMDSAYISKEGEERRLPVEVINYETDYDNRIRGLVDGPALKSSTVAFFGIGNGGGETVLDFFRSGLENAILIDIDFVSLKNICRSIYTLCDIGSKKTDALTEKIMRINPNANVTVYDENILKMDRKKLMEIIKASDLVVEGTDNMNTKRRINGIAHSTTPVLYPGVYPGGKGGDVLFTTPETPCLICVFGSIMKNSKSDEERRGWDYTLDEPKPMPALITDIKVVAARTVKLGLAMLTSKKDMSLLNSITEPDCTLLIIGNQKGVYGSEQPFFEMWAETSVNPECPCQELQ